MADQPDIGPSSALRDRRLVIFGCGYVGTALARVAVAAGAQVTALTRNRERAAALAGDGVNAVVADLAAADWHSRITDADLAVNCVAAGGGSPADYRQTYVAGLASIHQWAAVAANPPGTFVYTGSTSVYPQGGGVTVDESASTAGASPVGRVLLEAEESALRPEIARRSFVLRLAGIYGPGRHHLLDQLRAGATGMAGGTHRLNLVQRDDIVASILACLTAPASVEGGIFNVADGAPAPREEVIRWLAARLGRPAPAFSAPSGRRGGDTPPPDRIISSAKLQTVLGWRPRFPDFRAGYEDILHH